MINQDRSDKAFRPYIGLGMYFSKKVLASAQSVNETKGLQRVCLGEVKKWKAYYNDKPVTRLTIRTVLHVKIVDFSAILM